METVQKIALFIDAENVSSRYGKLIMKNLEQRGEVFIRRIYGNWEKTGLHKWNECILTYGMRTVHQIDFSTGKNANDMSLAIDAMDVLYKHSPTTFAIVSNDSDFTPLAVRLREYGVQVIGIGRDNSSISFQKACNEFISLDFLINETDDTVSKKIETSQVTLPVEENVSAHEKISELERKIAELERKLDSPKWSIAVKLTAEENKISALQKSPGKIKQNIILKTSTPNLDENILPVETSTADEVATPIEIEPVTAFKLLPEPSPIDSNVTVELSPIAVDTPTVETSMKTATADKNISVELKAAIPAQISKSKKRTVEREKALNQRFAKCGQNGMKNPKKKMQQIHDVLHETAKNYGDQNGFVPLSFAGQDIQKKNLGFGIKDFGYTLLNEFIGDFPELYELTHSKPRSFRYRCI